MAVDRCASASMSEAREALINVAVDALSAHRLAQNLPAGAVSAALHAPASLRLLPLYLLALLKRVSTITPRVAMWSMTGSDRRGWPRTCPLAPSAPRSTRPPHCACCRSICWRCSRGSVPSHQGLPCGQ
ncbi:uncharacterized protein [Choristoneura fumiferana]|uniref:uncharacterized protein n=1 Tax=Choristoneura fumiferana TaxID=7141 RepID=UPI003D158D7B